GPPLPGGAVRRRRPHPGRQRDSGSARPPALDRGRTPRPQGRRRGGLARRRHAQRPDARELPRPAVDPVARVRRHERTGAPPARLELRRPSPAPPPPHRTAGALAERLHPGTALPPPPEKRTPFRERPIG